MPATLSMISSTREFIAPSRIGTSVSKSRSTSGRPCTMAGFSAVIIDGIKVLKVEAEGITAIRVLGAAIAVGRCGGAADNSTKTREGANERRILAIGVLRG